MTDLHEIASRLVAEVRRYQHEPGRFDVADAMPYMIEASAEVLALRSDLAKARGEQCECGAVAVMSVRWSDRGGDHECLSCGARSLVSAAFDGSQDRSTSPLVEWWGIPVADCDAKQDAARVVLAAALAEAVARESEWYHGEWWDEFDARTLAAVEEAMKVTAP